MRLRKQRPPTTELWVEIEHREKILIASPLSMLEDYTKFVDDGTRTEWELLNFNSPGRTVVRLVKRIKT